MSKYKGTMDGLLVPTLDDGQWLIDTLWPVSWLC